MVGLLARRFWIKHHTSKWSQCTAVVGESEITESAGRGKLYYVRVLYEYKLMRVHSVSCILPSEFGTGDKSEAKALLDRYHRGASVPVYVDPQNEERSMLSREISWMELLVLFLFTAIGVALTWLSFFQKIR